MPHQRALIAYNDGVETLVVESSFQGEGKELAWIIPVPAKPTAIEKVSTGIFSALEMSLQPKVVDKSEGLIFLGLFFLLWALFLLISGRFVPIRSLLMAVLVMFMISLGFAGLSRGGIERSPQIKGVQASQSISVGSYDVNVLEVETFNALNQWLSANGFKEVLQVGESAVNSYIAEGWKLVAAKLRREGEGFSRPHPLKISFPSPSPVYPMRLTQLAGSDLHLELFVLAAQEAKVAGMDVFFVDEFIRKESGSGCAKRAYCLGNKTYRRIGLPSLVDQMGSTCVLTWLKGDFANSQLNHDFSIGKTVPRFVISTVYTPRGAEIAALERAMMAGGLILLPGALLWTWRKRKSPAPLLLEWVIFATVLVSTGVGFVSYRSLPKAEVVLDTESHQILSPYDVIKHLKKHPDIVAKMSVQDIEQYFLDWLARYRYKNPYTGEPFALEEALGGVVIVQNDRGIAARLFSEPNQFYHRGATGLPYDIQITGEECDEHGPDEEFMYGYE
ncbi:MAG TPA: DUF2330 domain-containing protein [Candidatus Hydrogenedentes bacterium]|nr:DUF2330 domain-containing protein [Candidatus Hydrogenedentota bacterium]